MSPLTKAQRRNDEKWDVCRGCGHYRVEHGGRGGACIHVPPEVQDPDPRDRCACSPFDPRSTP